MSFAFPLLLGGLVLVSVPILLHLIMRQKPKHLLFPAFRFLLQRHRTNLRKLRLRHLLLLALRITLIAAVCLALARPRADGPVVVLLFDTSPSMDYKVGVRSPRTSKLEDRSRLDEAKRRGLELLGQLPDSSRVLVLDTAGSNRVWLSPGEARQRIDRLKIRPDSLSVTHQLADAYEAFLELAREKKESKDLPRFLYVFSDRTRGCWEPSLLPAAQQQADQVLPPFDKLQELPDKIPAVTEALEPLPRELPTFKEPRALTAALRKLRDYIASADSGSYPDEAGARLIPRARGEVRALIRALEAPPDSLANKGKEYRGRLLRQLVDFLHAFRGVHEVFVDVGVDRPKDLAILSLDLPQHIDRPEQRQVFWEDEKLVLKTTVRATGTAYNARVECRLVDEDRAPSRYTIPAQDLTGLKAGTMREVAFAIDCARLGPGLHQVEVKVPALDSLGFNDRRYVTFKVMGSGKKGKGKGEGHDPHQVLVVADQPGLATAWTVALDSTGEFRCTVQTTSVAGKLGPQDLVKFKTICLFEVARPDRNLWALLERYVQRGGSLVVIPGGEAMNTAASKKAYNENAVARRLLPGRLVRVVTAPRPGATWDWQPNVFQHPLLKPFQKWISNPEVDFVEVKRRASRYWKVEPRQEGGDVLIRYEGNPGDPALLETVFDKKKRWGKVLLFTTPLDGRNEWNNYMERLNSFALILPHRTLRYLAGDTEEVNLNFWSGEPVILPLPLDPRRPPYSVSGPSLEDADSTLVPAENENTLQIKGAVHPGNYPVYDSEGARIARFSVNVPAAECDLTRVPEAHIAGLFGPGAVLAVDADTDFVEALGSHWKKPIDLLPWLLAVVLLVLAVENLLANKFYRREAADQPDGSKPERALP